MCIQNIDYSINNYELCFTKGFHLDLVLHDVNEKPIVETHSVNIYLYFNSL